MEEERKTTEVKIRVLELVFDYSCVHSSPGGINSLINLLVIYFYFFKKGKAMNESLRVVSLICNAEGLEGKSSG